MKLCLGGANVKAIAVLGSPRSKKNTDTVLDYAILGLRDMGVEVEKIKLKELSINPCISCDACGKTGKCFKRDDMTGLYEKFDSSDIVVIASPLYFNSVSSITKTMIDRCQAFWSSKYILNQPLINTKKERKGLFICTAGAPQSEEGFIGATVVMDLFFKAINTNYEYNLLLDNTDKLFAGERNEVLNQATTIGRELGKYFSTR